jgi:hypothetical protein
MHLNPVHPPSLDEATLELQCEHSDGDCFWEHPLEERWYQRLSTAQDRPDTDTWDYTRWQMSAGLYALQGSLGPPQQYQAARGAWDRWDWGEKQVFIRKLKYLEAYIQWAQDLGSVVANRHQEELLFTSPTEGEHPTLEWAERELSSRMDDGYPLLYPRVWDKVLAIQETTPAGSAMWQHDVRLLATDSESRDRLGQGYRVWAHLWEVQRWAWARDYQGDYQPGLGWEGEETTRRVAFQQQLYLVAYRQLVGYYQDPANRPPVSVPVAQADLIEEEAQSPIRGVTEDPFDLDWFRPAPRVPEVPPVDLAAEEATTSPLVRSLQPPLERIDQWLSQLGDDYPAVTVELAPLRGTPPSQPPRARRGFYPSPASSQPSPATGDFQRRAAAALERSRQVRSAPGSQSPASSNPRNT